MSADPSYEACQPRNCGTVPNMSYPFYIEGVGAEYCGLQRFRIACEEKKPIFRTHRGPYVIKNISYESHSVRLVDLDVVNANCVVPKHMFAFDKEYSPFKFNSSHANLQFFFRCNKSFAPSFETSLVPCASNSSHPSLVALVPKDEDFEKNRDVLDQYCEFQVAVPVDLEGHWQPHQTIKTVDYTELLLQGFTLVWYGDTCANCRATGGRCGVHNDAEVCFCPDGPHLQHCKSSGSGGRKILPLALGLATTALGIGVLIILFYCLSKKLTFFWKKPNPADRSIKTFLKNYGPIQVSRYSYSDVKKMTNSFKEKLGQGGFGTVYKGKLHDGCLVAVKVLNESKADGEDFVNEVATISRTSHVNIVSLMGFCFHGAKKALVYEYMPNGSLEKFVFNENAIENSHQLDWETHFRISLGIARGLEYLHRGCNTRILHFDIKPDNILLDANFVPKISDFGLAKICTRTQSLVSMLGPRGTIGYIAPEVFSRNFGGISHKSDVYSYGMMVLEMIGGRKNVNVRVDNSSEIYFPHWVYKRLEQEEEVRLQRITNEEDRIKVRKMIIVSLWCVQTDPSNRRAIGKVIEMLEGSLDSLQIPPKPFLSSPPRSATNEASSTLSHHRLM